LTQISVFLRALTVNALLWLAGCATLTAPFPADMPVKADLADVPFFDQADKQCGPAALAAVLGSSGRNVDPRALSAQMYLPERGGTLQLELIASARRQGMLAVQIPSTTQALFREVASGQPIIVLQNLGLSFAPRWHYAVVMGYDLPAREVVLHSGSTRRLRMSLFTFEQTWARSARWAIVVSDPTHIPITISEHAASQAAAALERTSPNAAAAAFSAILQRWPDNLLAMMALGNQAYTGREFAAARQRFEAATRAHPSNADTWNNLAQTHLALGDRYAAQAAAERAVQLGGERLATYQRTLARIKNEAAFVQP
jgi:predicted double-glycine peptidase